MSQMANLLLKDDAATPNEWSLKPITDTPNPMWRTVVPTIPIAGQIRLQTYLEKQKNGQTKVTTKLEMPVMETLGASGTSTGYVAPQKVAYVLPGIFTMFVDPRSTSQDRVNLMKMMVGFLQGASSTSGNGTLGQADNGAVWLNAQRPALELYRDLILPN